MSSAFPPPGQISVWPGRLRKWALKAASLVVTGVIFGLLYSWAAPRFYRPDQRPGFWMGTLHGALMPVAAPSLLMGEDVPIYAPNNTGRSYKLGYIGGINLCGFIFFGLTFWQPGGRRGEESPQGERPPQ
jgi:hypothetical protein